jgi:hypothetical protein
VTRSGRVWITILISTRYASEGLVLHWPLHKNLRIVGNNSKGQCPRIWLDWRHFLTSGPLYVWRCSIFSNNGHLWKHVGDRQVCKGKFVMQLIKRCFLAFFCGYNWDVDGEKKYDIQSPPTPKNEDRKINQSIKKRIKKQATSKTVNNFFKKWIHVTTQWTLNREPVCWRERGNECFLREK